MALKLKIPRRKGGAHGRLSDPLVKAGLAFFLICSAAFLAIFSYYYVTYSRIVDRRMRGHIFNNAARIYAAPETVRLGEKITPAEVADDLKRAGYTPEGAPGEQSPLGTYRVMGHGIEIKPGPQSYHNAEAAVIRDDDSGKVDRIASLSSDRDLTAYDLEPQLVTALFDSEHRAKRRLISYDQIPKVMVDAVTAIEDRRFFQHSGVNFYRLFEAALVDLRERKHEQGGSTLTMQIARGFFLTPEKTYKRKATEILISVILEQRFSKQQIFELYANEVYMGQRGSFTINGFGEAARSYFNKDIRSITLPEAALLAGMIQRPSYLSPYKYPDRALERRNLVLDSMVETGAITREQADAAKATPLKLAPPNVEAYDAPYFVDLVKEQLSDRFKEQDLNDQAYRIYTTLDPGLQHDAAEAVEIGIKQVDAKINKLRTRRVKVGTGKSAKWETKVLPGPQAQVALIALDPRTGEVRALVGGRNYAWSQLNHAVAKRPTGSVFKPFVYAAAVDTGLTAVENAPPPTPPAPTTVAAATTTPIPAAAAAPASAGLFTPASVVDDSPTTFTYGDQIYEPRNYKEEYHGPVSLTYALAHSLNNATVKLAEEVGYDKVAALAKAAGITSVQATPAMALGAYDATPLEIAGAYTMFANQGTKVSPILLTSVRDARGGSLAEFKTDQKQVLDPRVAYVVTKMMEAVINTGTAAGVRGMGFSAPAAGKTGTSHDGWFAGYTSNLLCIVWVGYDDYSDIRLSGADTAAPIWAEFMKRAVERPAYRDVHEFAQPAGVVDVVLDKATNRLATPNCPDDYSAAFIAGTEPRDTCDHVATADQRGFFSRLLGLGQKPVPPPAVSNAQQQQQQPGVKPGGEQKKGFFGKIFGIFKGDDTSNKPENPTPAPPANSGSGQDPGNPPH